MSSLNKIFKKDTKSLSFSLTKNSDKSSELKPYSVFMLKVSLLLLIPTFSDHSDGLVYVLESLLEYFFNFLIQEC